jgi:hypothetical protein
MRLWIALALTTACGAKTAAPAMSPEPVASEVAEAPQVAAPAAQADAPRPAAAVEPGESLGAFAGVVAHTGEARTLEDLRGHATVVWFFPAAGTPG